MAIFKFFLNVGVSSHAGRPPGMAAVRHITKSFNVDVAIEWSLNNESNRISYVYFHLEGGMTHFECSCDVHDVITACGTGCSTNNMRIMNCRAISGNSLMKKQKDKERRITFD